MPTVGSPGETPDAGWTVDETTVGLAAVGLSCAELPLYEGPTKVPAGTTISEQRIASGINLSAGDITVERSCVQPTTAAAGMPVVTTTNHDTGEPAAGKVTIRDSEIDGSKLSPELAGHAGGISGVADLISNYVHGFGSGIAVMGAGETFDALIERNYVTGLVAWGDPATDGTHSDAFTVRDFDTSQRSERQLIVRNNRFDCDSGADTGAFFVQTYSGRIDNLLAEGNLLEGGGYQLGLNEANHPYRDVRALNNRFTGTGWGPAYVQGGAGWDEWAGNYLYDPAGPDGRGTEVPAP